MLHSKKSSALSIAQPDDRRDERLEKALSALRDRIAAEKPPPSLAPRIIEDLHRKGLIGPAEPASHPKELYVLLFTGMWERFGYYLMLSIFVYYLNERLGMSPGEAMSFYGTYIAMVCLSPILGGALGDRVLGHRRAALVGTLVLSLGYFLLSLDREPLLYAAIGVLAVGNGLFKPNISTMIGEFYQQNDPRRDAAFGIFYFGMNLGAFLAPLAASFLRSHYGWGAAFSAAGAGMLIGLSGFALLGRRPGARNATWSTDEFARSDDVFARRERIRALTRRERIRALLIIYAIVTFFWIAFQQNGSTLAFWARDNTDLTMGGLFDHPLNPEIFASVSPLIILLLTPLLLGIFRWLHRRGMEPSTPAKIGLGMVMTAAAYGLMTMASLRGGDQGTVTAGWLVSSYFVITGAELLMWSMSLSMVTRLAPRGTVAMMVGVWYLAAGFGNKMAGELGRLWTGWTHHAFFALLAGGSLMAAVMVAVQLPRLVAAMDADAPQQPRGDSDKVPKWCPYASAPEAQAHSAKNETFQL